MPPTHHLLPATAHNIPTFTSIYLSAFTDSLALTAFPRSSPHIRAWWTATNLADFHSQPSARFLKVVERQLRNPGDEKHENNEQNEKIIAYAKWNVPIHVGDEGEIVNGGDDADDLPVWPEGADVELCDDIFPAFARERAGRMGGRAHYYLEIIATLPTHRGLGAASQLLRWGLDRADQEGVEAYVEASAAVVPMYEKYGFRTVGTYEARSIRYVESFMVRAPNGGEEGVRGGPLGEKKRGKRWVTGER